MQGRQPTTYQDWLNELNNSGKAAEMKMCAVNAYKLHPNKRAAQRDIALVIAEMYRRDITRVADRPLVSRAIRDRFDDVSGTLFKKPILDLIEDIKTALPNFDARSTVEMHGKKPLGFLKADVTVDKKGEERAPLGFVRKPRARQSKEGKEEPSLGFLGDDVGTQGGLGFL